MAGISLSDREHLAGGREPYRRGDPLPPPMPAVEVVRAMHEAGWPEEEWVTGVAVARRESALAPDLIGHANPDSPSWDYGLWQISDYWHRDRLFRVEERGGHWTDPYWNAVIALEVWEQGKSIHGADHGWYPWHTYTGGGYRQYLDMAEAAVDAYKASLVADEDPEPDPNPNPPMVPEPPSEEPSEPEPDPEPPVEEPEEPREEEQPMSSFTYFLRDAVERAVKTAAQTALGVLGADQVLSIVDVDFGQAAGVVALTTVLSLLSSIVSYNVGEKGTASVRSNGAEEVDDHGDAV